MGTTGMGVSRRLGGRAALAGFLITTALTPILAAGAVAQTADVQTPGAQTASSERAFDIPAQPLSSALAQFGRQSGLQVSVDGALVRDLQAPAVAGVMRNEEALRRLLSGTGLVASRTDARTLMIRQAAGGAASGGDPIILDTLVVEGREGGIVQETGAERDARKADEIFDLNLSTDYTGKDEVERYKGISVADVLQGLTNVYSGDARNGGALDANIRGIQGAGRSPVIIDGTEQALVVWRGYNGVSNRSYVDPSLIAGVQVLKGPASVREVNSQIGGAVVIDTLDAGDILEPGETFGVELRLEGGNNSTDPRLPTLSTGLDYREVDGIFGEDGMTAADFFAPVADATLRVEPRTEDDNDVFSLGDRAARIAVAGRPRDDIEIFGAYAYRERGNYFAGVNNTDFYSQEDLPEGANFFMQRLALTFRPGNEVTNSSSELESWLFKTTWRIADDQILQFGYRNTGSEFGEILPSRLFRSDIEDNNSIGDVQWPLSRTRNHALNLEYKYAPDSPWLDLHANVWTTRENSNTYSAGGYPNVPSSRDDPTLINTALANARGTRYGITASNRMALLPSLDITIGGHYQYEKLRSDDSIDDLPDGHLSFRQFPREGRRQEYRADFNVEWRPTDFLTFNGGVARAGYWVYDDGLDGLLEGGREFRDVARLGITQGYDVDAFGLEAYEAFERAGIQPTLDSLDLSDPFQEFLYNFILDSLNQAIAGYAANPRPFRVGTFEVNWLPDESGKFRRADMPAQCQNASLDDFDIDAVIGGIAAESPRGDVILSPVVRSALSGIGCGPSSGDVTETFILSDPDDNRARRGAGWEPYVSATLNLSDDIRVYVRYAERFRFPSMFESTLGFSASINLAQPLKPERIRSYEAAYIQDFSRLFGLEGDQRADFKLVYFHNTVNDVIERGDNLRFENLDKQVIDGVELQARIDTGGFFFDLGAARIITNQVCDESRAAVLDFDSPNIDVPDCVDYGFLGGYLLTQAIPTQTVNLTLGGRFFDRRLELGTRTTYYSEYDNPQLEEFVTGEDRLSGFSLNVPYAFGETLLLDAYARFNFSDRFTAEIVGTNITDQFFADPLSRSLIPAPGRQIRLSVTGRL